MPAALALAIILAAGLSAAPANPGNVVSPLDVPGHPNTVVMARPDRSGDKIICRNEPVPDSRLVRRVCLRRRDRDAAAARQQQQLTQRQHVCDIVWAC